MARGDKSALINKAVAAIRAGEFADYSKAAARFGVDRTSVLRHLQRSQKQWFQRPKKLFRPRLNRRNLLLRRLRPKNQSKKVWLKWSLYRRWRGRW
jgi:hypothetical protein